jgi:hypothetical protein
VTFKCRGADTFLYLKGGIVRKFNTWGPTAFYGEYYKGWRSLNSSDEDMLRAFEVNPDEAKELAKSVQTVWGFGVVQTLERTKTRLYQTDYYLGFRNYSLDMHLIGESGAPVPARSINNWQAIMAGVRFRWGKIDKDEKDE